MCSHLIKELQDKAKFNRTERTEKSKNRVKHFNTPVLVTDRIKADRNSIKM